MSKVTNTARMGCKLAALFRLLSAMVAVLMGMAVSADTIVSKTNVSKDESIMRSALWTNEEVPSSAHDYVLTLESSYEGDRIDVDGKRLITFQTGADLQNIHIAHDCLLPNVGLSVFSAEAGNKKDV